MSGARYKNLLPGSPVCQELGDQYFMQKYVEEAGNTWACKIDVPENCSEMANLLIQQYEDETISDDEAKRIEKKSTRNMMDKNKGDLRDELAIVLQLKAKQGGSSEESHDEL